MDDLVWEDPPRRAWDHQRIARELRERPGEWARVGICPTAATSSTMATKIRQGRAPAYLPAGHFEAMARKVHGYCFVYARFTGGAR